MTYPIISVVFPFLVALGQCVFVSILASKMPKQPSYPYFCLSPFSHALSAFVFFVVFANHHRRRSCSKNCQKHASSSFVDVGLFLGPHLNKQNPHQHPSCDCTVQDGTDSWDLVSFASCVPEISTCHLSRRLRRGPSSDRTALPPRSRGLVWLSWPRSRQVVSSTWHHFPPSQTNSHDLDPKRVLLLPGPPIVFREPLSPPVPSLSVGGLFVLVRRDELGLDYPPSRGSKISSLGSLSVQTWYI